MSEAEQQADYVPTPSIAEMCDGLLAQLYSERHSLKGIALVQALKALVTLKAQAQPESDGDDEETAGLLDRIHALPPEHAAELVRKEIVRLEGDLARNREALAELEGVRKE